MADEYRLSETRLWTRLIDAFMDGGQFPATVFGYEQRRVYAEGKANRIIAALDAEQTDPIAQAAEQAAQQDISQARADPYWRSTLLDGTFLRYSGEVFAKSAALKFWEPQEERFTAAYLAAVGRLLAEGEAPDHA